ncbi:MAG: low affinity iron permease family protein [Sphingomicrobium sp.]
MASQPDKSMLDRIGGMVSSWVSDLAATPLAQIAVIIICAAWFLFGYKPDILTAILSIMAITLTQMVLNRQNKREADDHRRDVAMHAKLDELLIAHHAARNEMAGIEELEEAEIAELKEEVKDSIDRAAEAVGDESHHEAAKAAAEKAVESVARGSKSRAKPRATRKKA